MRNLAVAAVAAASLVVGGLGSPGSALAEPSEAATDPADGPASRDLSLPATISLPVSTVGGAYTLAPDGTFWTATGGDNGFSVQHYDDAGNDLGDAGWTKSGGYGLVKGIGYWGGRVYLTVGDNLRSWEAHTGATDRLSDTDTVDRLGHNQMILRVTGGGEGMVALGQTNKVGLMDLTNTAPEHPFYSQSWWGGGITTGYPASGMEFCLLPATGPPASGQPGNTCGKRTGHPDVFNYPIDMVATGTGESVAVLSSGASTSTAQPRVSILNVWDKVVLSTFGSFGSGDGEFDNPFSIVRNPVDGHYFVSDQNNRRILEFDSGGGDFVAGYGIGVAGGAGFERCGPGGATCRAASSGPYYGRLDLLGGKLYAQRGSSGTLEVFQLVPGGAGGGGTGGSGTGGGTGGGTVSTQPQPAAPGPDQVRLKADKVKVTKGKKTRLTATVSPSAVCSARTVLFQVKVGGGWDNLGGAIPLRPDCTATRKSERVRDKTQYRVVSINTANTATMATSPTVTVKPRAKK
jgi:hypothetical protein